MFLFSAPRSGISCKVVLFYFVLFYFVELTLTKDHCPECRGHEGQKDMVSCSLAGKLVSQGIMNITSSPSLKGIRYQHGI